MLCCCAVSSCRRPSLLFRRHSCSHQTSCKYSSKLSVSRCVALVLLMAIVIADSWNAVEAAHTHTKSRITITQTQTSDQTLTETVSMSVTRGSASITAPAKSLTETKSPTSKRSSTFTQTKTRRTGSPTPPETGSVTMSTFHTTTITINVTRTPASESLTQTKSKELSRSITLSRSVSGLGHTSSVTVTLIDSPSVSAFSSKSVTLTEIPTRSPSRTQSLTKSIIWTDTQTLFPSHSATYYRNSKTSMYTSSVTVTLPITQTLSTHTNSLIITPTLTLIATGSLTLTNQLASTSFTLRDTVTRSLIPSLTPSLSEWMSITRTNTRDRNSSSSSLVPTFTTSPSLSDSSIPTYSRTVTISTSGSQSLSEQHSETRSISHSRTLPRTHTKTIVMSITDTPSFSEAVSTTKTRTISASPSGTYTPTVTESFSLTTTDTLTPTASRTVNITDTQTVSMTLSISSPQSKTLQTMSMTGSSDVTVTATNTLTPPPTLTLTLSHFEPVTLGSLVSFGLTALWSDTAPCMRVVMFIGFFPFAGLLFSALYVIVSMMTKPKIDVDTYGSVKQWRSLLALHSYFSILFPCHYQCAIHHAILGLIHYNLTTGIVAAITLSLLPQTDSQIVIALTSIFAAVTPHLARPFLNEVMYYYSFDKRDLHRIVYVDLDEEDGETIPVRANDGGELTQSAALKHKLDEMAEAVPDVGVLRDDSDLSSFGDVELAEPEAPLDERAFQALNSFVFHFTDDVGTHGKNATSTSLKSFQPKSITNSKQVSSAESSRAPGQFEDSEGFFAEFTPLHTPRKPVDATVDMDGPGLFPYMPVIAHMLWKGVFLSACFGPCVALNYVLTQRLQSNGSSQCSGEMTGFMKSLIIALILDFVFFQQAYLAILLGLRLLRSKEDKESFSELHPYSGEMRPMEGKLLRQQMELENREVRKVLDEEQQRRRIEERLDLDDHIEIIAAPAADVPQELDAIDDDIYLESSMTISKKVAPSAGATKRPTRVSISSPHKQRPEAIDAHSEEGSSDDEEGSEEETEESEEDPQPQSPPKSQHYSSYGGNMMMSMLHASPMTSPAAAQRK